MAVVMVVRRAAPHRRTEGLGRRLYRLVSSSSSCSSWAMTTRLEAAARQRRSRRRW